MKSIISKSMLVLAICATLFSFRNKPGGEGFEIYLNNKVVVQQFGKDAHNKVLKEFNYADVATPVGAMTVNVKDLLILMRGNNQLKLYYSSSELPKGRMLVSFSTSAISTTTHR